MRTITINELPDDFQHQVVIKTAERSRHRCMATALERTLHRCTEIHAEYQLQTLRLRENCEREAFHAGFQMFFSEVIALLNEYQRQQNHRQRLFREEIALALKESLHDPVIVERIIHHLQERCGHQKSLRIIIPKNVILPDIEDKSNYQYTDDNHITVQNDMDAIRFPSETLSRSWLKQADDRIISINDTINNLVPDLLREMAGQLIAISNQLPDATTQSDKDKTDD